MTNELNLSDAVLQYTSEKTYFENQVRRLEEKLRLTEQKYYEQRKELLELKLQNEYLESVVDHKQDEINYLNYRLSANTTQQEKSQKTNYHVEVFRHKTAKVLIEVQAETDEKAICMAIEEAKSACPTTWLFEEVNYKTNIKHKKDI